MIYKNLDESSAKRVLRIRKWLDFMAALVFLFKGDRAAYKAVMKPKEGTILTVARVVAEDALKQAKKEIVEDMKRRQMLINRNTDFAMLEQFIQRVNENPNLKITFTTSDGTTVELKTVTERKKTYTEVLGEMS